MFSGCFPCFIKKTAFTCCTETMIWKRNSVHFLGKTFPHISVHQASLFPVSVRTSNFIRALYCNGTCLYLTHGHQASSLNSTLWRLGRFLVRYVWKPLEQIGILDPTNAAKNYTVKKRSEQRLNTWAEENNKILITGHTHRPILNEAPSLYINTGSCVHPRCITCIELENGTLTLVKWFMGTRKNGDFYLEREALSTRTLSGYDKIL